MPIDPSDTIAALQQGAAHVPAAAIAIALLAGPTIVWILYRFFVSPRRSRYSGGHGDLLWMCVRCRSANEARSSRCYRCGAKRDDIVGDLQVYDGHGIVTLPGDGTALTTASVTSSIPLDPAAVATAADLQAVGAVSISDLIAAEAAAKAAGVAAPAPTVAEPPPPALPPEPVGPAMTPPRRLVAVGPGAPSSGTPTAEPVPVMDPAATVPAPTNRFRRRYATIQAGETPPASEERVEA